MTATTEYELLCRLVDAFDAWMALKARGAFARVLKARDDLAVFRSNRRKE